MKSRIIFLSLAVLSQSASAGFLLKNAGNAQAEDYRPAQAGDKSDQGDGAVSIANLSKAAATEPKTAVADNSGLHEIGKRPEKIRFLRRGGQGSLLKALKAVVPNENPPWHAKKPVNSSLDMEQTVLWAGDVEWTTALMLLAIRYDLNITLDWNKRTLVIDKVDEDGGAQPSNNQGSKYWTAEQNTSQPGCPLWACEGTNSQDTNTPPPPAEPPVGGSVQPTNDQQSSQRLTAEQNTKQPGCPLWACEGTNSQDTNTPPPPPAPPIKSLAVDGPLKEAVETVASKWGHTVDWQVDEGAGKYVLQYAVALSGDSLDNDLATLGDAVFSDTLRINFDVFANRVVRVTTRGND